MFTAKLKQHTEKKKKKMECLFHQKKLFKIVKQSNERYSSITLRA